MSALKNNPVDAGCERRVECGEGWVDSVVSHTAGLTHRSTYALSKVLEVFCRFTFLEGRQTRKERTEGPNSPLNRQGSLARRGMVRAPQMRGLCLPRSITPANTYCGELATASHFINIPRPPQSCRRTLVAARNVVVPAPHHSNTVVAARSERTQGISTFPDTADTHTRQPFPGSCNNTQPQHPSKTIGVAILCHQRAVGTATTLSASSHRIPRQSTSRTRMGGTPS